MASLRDLINSRSPEEEEKLKQESLAFQKKMGMEDAPEEEGVIEGDLEDLVPNTNYEMGKAGWKMGMMPGGPSAIKPSAKQAEAVAEEGSSIIAKLRKAGFKPSEIDEAAENLRLGKSHTFHGPDGPVYTAGPESALGKELNALGRTSSQTAEEAAGGFKYNDSTPATEAADRAQRIAKPIPEDRQRWIDKTGVDPRGLNGADYLKKVREAKK